MKRRFHSGRRAYILMEVMLAAGIFAFAGVGMAIALNDIAKTFVEVRKVHIIRSELNSRLNEARITTLAPLTAVEPENSQGVTYQKEIAALDLKNQDGLSLTNLYRITVTARWKEGNEVQEEDAEVYVYQP